MRLARLALPLALLSGISLAVPSPVAASSSKILSGRWTSSGPVEASVDALAVSESDPSIVYADVHYDGIFRSGDGGGSWERVLADQDAQDVAVDPVDPGIAYVASSGGSPVLRTRNGGRSWATASVGLPPNGATRLAIDPRHPSTLYVATPGGVFKSTDSGSHWRSTAVIGVDLSGYLDLAIDPAHPATLYLAVQAQGLFRTRDGGASWQASRLASTSVSGLVALDPTTPDIVYAGNLDGGLFVSRDRGAHWSVLTAGLPDARVATALLVTAGFPATVYVGYTGYVDGGLYASRNGGGSWRTLGSQQHRIIALGSSAATPSTLYAGLSKWGAGPGLVKSTDGGSTWGPANRGLPGTEIDALAAAATDPPTVYAGGRTVFSTTDLDTGWSSITSPMHGSGANSVTALAVDPSDPDRLYASAYPRAGGLFASRDAGASWIRLAAGYALAVAVDPADPDVLYLGVRGTGVLKTEDGGATWSEVLSTRGRTRPYAIVVDPLNPATVYAGVLPNDDGKGGGIWKTTDGGRRWHPRVDGLGASSIRTLAINPERPSTLYAGTNTGIWKSVDGARTWTQVDAADPYVGSLVVDPARPATVFASTTNGVVGTMNGGATWSSAGTGFGATYIHDLAIDPTGAVLYAGTYDGVWDLPLA